MRQNVLTFLASLFIWVIFSGKLSSDVIFVGIIASIIVSFLFSDMLFRLSNRKTNWWNYIRRFILFLFFIPVFFYETLISSLKISRHVFERKKTFNPGIVKVKTRLTNVSALTLLANLITLTPGTLTLDFVKSERSFYIHWIDVKSFEDAIERKKIIERFENWLEVIFS